MTSTDAPSAVSPAWSGRLGAHVVLAVVTVVALLIRWAYVDVESGDYRAFLDPWFTHLLQAGGFAGLADLSSNYNSPYLVLLAGLTYLPFPELIMIKALSVVFDLLLAFFAYRIVAVVRPGSRWLPSLVAGAVLLLPTVVMNSGVWAQCDAVYASLVLASLYFLLTRRSWRACLFFGLALAFKLQAVFFLPVLLGVLVLNRLRLRALLAVPAVFLAALVPAWLAGRSLVTQLSTYPAQLGLTGGDGDPGRVAAGRAAGRAAERGMGPGGPVDPGTGHAFTYNAPTWYAWLPADAGSGWKYAGLGLAALVAVGFAVILLRRRRGLEAADILLLAATATAVLPLLLPEMHERYFYLAEVLTVLAVVVHRGFSAVAACLQAASISTYLAYLTRSPLVPLEHAALVALIGLVLAAVLCALRLRRSGPGLAREPALSAD